MQERLMCPFCKVVINVLPMVYIDSTVRLLSVHFQQNPEVKERLRREYEEISNEEFRRRFEELVEVERPDYLG